jgi:transcriptional regulator with XRE-family HTH domain
VSDVAMVAAREFDSPQLHCSPSPPSFTHCEVRVKKGHRGQRQVGHARRDRRWPAASPCACSEERNAQLHRRRSSQPRVFGTGCRGWHWPGCGRTPSDAYMPADLIRDARQSASLSARALARPAQVPSSTVLRIESGKVDPTVGMLRRLLEAAGQELFLRSTPRQPSQRCPVLAELADAWVESPDGHPDWTKLRSFLDDLSLHPDRVDASIIRRPAKAPSPVLDTLLAGIAEKLADDAGIRRPPWTRRTPCLREEWSPFGTPRLKAMWRSSAPPQLLERGLVIDEPSLWRNPETVGA